VGSALAGAKAGAVASLYFAGSVSLFNILLLLTFKAQVISYLQTFSDCAGSAAQSCLSVLVIEVIPIDDFLRTLVVAMLFAVATGVYFDYLPGPTYSRKTLLMSIIMLVAMLFLDLYGVVTSVTQEVAMVAFELMAVVFYALIMARLYRRFTREVEFQTVTPAGRVVVDHRDLTGKKRTFSVKSSHKVEAAGELKTFRGWLVSGGVTVKEPKETKTSILVTGDGMLKLA
jgi:hypothetical protein